MHKKKAFPPLKKDIKDFLLKEEASMIKKDVVKTGLGLLVLSLGLKAGMKAGDTMAATGDCCEGCPCRHCNHNSACSSCTSCTSCGTSCGY